MLAEISATCELTLNIIEICVVCYRLACDTTTPTADKFYHKYGWVLLFAIGLLVTIPGVFHYISFNTDPATAEEIVGMSLNELEESNPKSFDLYKFYFQFGVLSDVGFGFLVAIISATAYRNGRTWAWYSLWSVPAFFAASIVLLYAYELSILAPLVFVILALLGLLLPFRTFFPKD
ncbi:hypothetical protein [Halorubrum sp. HHNYT27]|uniref:hypothetical protein n=1 Tax=Halorubrum sp. HHNYT27 TaxID=3402275 RepID=UPI003EBD5F5E